MRRSLRAAALFAALPLALTACDFLNPKASTKQGEEPLGKYAFLANAIEDSCLSALFTGAMSFEGTLSRTKNVFYFNGNGGSIEGTIAGKTFSVISGGTEQLDAYCSLMREETISGTFSADGLGIAGTYLIREIPVQGSNCINAVYGASRIFAQLPCVVRYTLTASQLEAPDAGVDGGTAASDGGATIAPDGGTLADAGLVDGGVTSPGDGG